MKRYFPILVILLLSVSLFACGGDNPATADAILTVSGGGVERTYSAADLRALPPATATVEGVTYAGVSLPTLLQDAGFQLDQITSVDAVADDDFSATYEPDLFTSEDTIVAYEQADGDLDGDEQPFRMALPEQPGRLNVRMLVRIEVDS